MTVSGLAFVWLSDHVRERDEASWVLAPRGRGRAPRLLFTSLKLPPSLTRSDIEAFERCALVPLHQQRSGLRDSAEGDPYPATVGADWQVAAV